MRGVRLLFGLILVAFLIGAPSSRADPLAETWLGWFGDTVSSYAGVTAFPLLDIAPGGRAEAMAGAYAAVGGDSGSLESNPAGTAESANPQLSLFHHEWLADSAIESAAFVSGVGPMGFGVGLKYFRVPFTGYDDGGERASSGDFTELIGVVNLSVRFIDTEWFSLSAGTNVKVAARFVSDTIDSGQSGMAFPFDLGFLSDIRLFDFSRTGARNFALGFVVRNIGSRVDFLDAPLPTAFTSGLAYSPFRFLLLSAGVSVPVDLTNMTAHWTDISYRIGASLEFASVVGIHAGAKIGSGTPRFALGTTLHLGKVSLDAAYSVDLARGLNPLESLSIGATFDLRREQGSGVAP